MADARNPQSANEKHRLSDWLYQQAILDTNPLRKLQQLVQQDQQAYKLVYSDVTAWNNLKLRLQDHINK